MAIQGTQVPTYTNTHCFSIFLMKKKIKIEKRKKKKNMLNKVMHKTRLAQNKKAKDTSNVKTKNKKGR